MAPSALTLRLCSTLGSSQFVCRINSSYFPSRARLNFRWIFKEFDLKTQREGIFLEFSCFIGKEAEESVADSSLDQ